MKRTLEDIRANLDQVGCDNETAREMCDEIERLRKRSTSDALNDMVPLPYTEDEPTIMSREQLVMKIIKLLPEERAEGLHLLDATRRMVERFKR